RRLGYVVVTAADGKGALAGLRDLSRLDLLLSDIVMPGLDGLRLVERARRLRPGLAIMLMSGFTEHGLARDGLAVASGSLLSKPFSRLELARKVRAAIDGRLSS
ncbi:MAG: response regulator, partial [Reyranellaceae bacterium]